MKATKCVLASVRAERESMSMSMCARARVCVLTSDRYTVDKRQAISHFSWLPSFRAQKYQTTSHFIHFAMRYINNEREKKRKKKTSSTAKWPGTKKHTKNTHTTHIVSMVDDEQIR